MIRANNPSLIIIIILSASCFQNLLAAKNPLQIDTISFEKDVWPHAYVYEDHSGLFVPGQSLDLRSFKRADVSRRSFESNLWVYVNVHNRTENDLNAVLFTGGLNETEIFFRREGDSTFHRRYTGKLVDYQQNDMARYQNYQHKVLIQLFAYSDNFILIHYKNKHQRAFEPALKLQDFSSWSAASLESISITSSLLGVFYGILFILMVVNAIFYFIFKDDSYISYSLYLVFVIIYEAIIYGIFDNTALIDHPKLYQSLLNDSIIIALIFYIWFLKSFLNTATYYKKWNKVFNYQMITLGITMLICNILIYAYELPDTAIDFRNIVFLIIIGVSLTFLSKVVFSGRALSVILFAGTFILILSGVASIVVYFMDVYENSDVFFQVGIILESTIFSVGLGIKSKIIWDQKEKLQASVNEDLEQKVKERTDQIAAQNEELIQQQEEITAHRDLLAKQNEIIEQQVNSLDVIRKNLESEVKSRTEDLRSTNKELIIQNTQLEQYAYITAHNLRAPVARLKGLTYLFEKLSLTDETNREILTRIKDSALDMEGVLNDLNTILEIKHLDTQNREVVQVREILEKIQNRLSDTISIKKVIFDLQLGIRSMHVIRPYFESILYNLINNGIKYSAENRLPRISIKTYSHDSGCYLEIADNGIGINLDQHREKLFGLYQRFHDHITGKGIGLYLVKTQVETMGGHIEIQSEEGVGTTFIIRFPGDTCVE